MSYIRTLHELECPECEKINFVDAGDIRDMTGFDPEACQCWNCKYCFNFEGEPAEEDEADIGFPANMLAHAEMLPKVKDEPEEEIS